MSRLRLVTALGLLVSALASAQTPCGLTQFGATDGGWMGSLSRVQCACADCPRVFVEVRLAGTGYGGPGSFSATTDNQWGSLYFSLAHLAAYQWRATPVLTDGGSLPTSVERSATADMLGPTDPVNVQLAFLDGGVIALSFLDSVDTGAGVEKYMMQFATASDPQFSSTGLSSGGSPLVSDLGPGDWRVAVVADDAVDNQSQPSILGTTLHVEASTTIAPPPAPLLISAALGTTPDVTVRIGSLGDAFHLIAERLDGGQFVAFPRTTAEAIAPTTAYGWINQEGRFRVRASRLVSGQASAWSAPSMEVLKDFNPPTAPSSLSVTELNDTFVLGWGPATDTVGVERYVVERAEGDGGFNVLSANVAGLTFTDSSLVPGLLRYQVAAIDFVQHRGPSIGLGQVWAGVADAGVADAGVADAGVADAGVADAGVADAGVTDAGVTDAGVTDAGLVDGRDGGIPETRGYEVGCGCGSLSQLAALGALIVLGRTRRRVR